MNYLVVFRLLSLSVDELSSCVQVVSLSVDELYPFGKPTGDSFLENQDEDGNRLDQIREKFLSKFFFSTHHFLSKFSHYLQVINSFQLQIKNRKISKIASSCLMFSSAKIRCCSLTYKNNYYVRKNRDFFKALKIQFQNSMDTYIETQNY